MTAQEPRDERDALSHLRRSERRRANRSRSRAHVPCRLAARSCLIYAVQADGHRVLTVEGLSRADGRLSVLQDSFCEMHGLQCGYCTPGMLIAAQALLDINPRPAPDEIREAISGNLCRCTGYQQIVDAIELAVRRMAEGET